ncbi:MAG: cell division protein FtsZ [Coprobacillus sp.]|nr:cell division protein FtsZ [Coprobacillus sp.]
MASENYDLDNFEPVAKIVVIGVGGGGSNAVNRMIDRNMGNVTYYVVNTDKQALSASKAPNRRVLGENTTGGLGAGGIPEIGRAAAEESEDMIKEMVKGAALVFVAAGMGGGTGTGAAPVIARIAKDAGALVVAIVTRPFTFEGPKKISNSIDGLNKLKENVDSIIVVSNDQLLRLKGNEPMGNAFEDADNILAQSVDTVVSLIVYNSLINSDFADVRNTLANSGLGLIGTGYGKGPNKTRDAALSAFNSPLLEASLKGAKRAIVSITCGQGVTLYDVKDCINYLTEASGGDIDIKFAANINDQLEDEMIVSIIAADFEQSYDFANPHLFEGVTDDDFPAPEAPRPIDIETPIAPTQEPRYDEEESEDDILPNFLKR